MSDHRLHPDSTDSLDLTIPSVREELVRAFSGRFAHLIGEIEKETGFNVEPLVSLFVELVRSANPYHPAADPSPEAWLYRNAAEILLKKRPRTERKRLRTRLALILSAPPHGLTAPEVAAALYMRENEVAGKNDPGSNTFQNDLSPDLEVDTAYLNTRISAVLEADPPVLRHDPRERKPSPLREALWLLGGLTTVLLALIVFLRSSASDQGRALFPTDTPPPPPLMEISSPKLKSLPESSPGDSNIYNNVSPVLSDNGRYILFVSNHPLIVPEDHNDALDVFLYEIQTGEVRRISVTDEGEELDGESFSAGISSDGSMIVYTHIPRSGEMQVILTDWQNQHSRQVNLLADGTVIPEAFASSISGDGSTVAFWGNPGGFADTRCTVDNPGEPCIRLFLYTSDNDALAPLFETGFMDDFWVSGRLPLSYDGSVIGLTINLQSELWARLGSPNATEAVLYNWRTEEVIPLNLNPDGEFGNGASAQPAISGDARSVAFFSSASDLIPDDTNDEQDLFYLDLNTSEITRINVAPDGKETSGNFIPLTFVGFSAPDISADGRQVVFTSSAPGLLQDIESTFCTFEIEQGRICAGIFIYMHDFRTTQQVRTIPLYEAGAGLQMVLDLTISNSADLIAMMTVAYGDQAICPNIGCTTIWMLREGTSRQVSDIHPTYLSARALQPWRFMGNIAGPDRWVKGIAVDPDGEWVAMGDNKGSLLVKAIDSGDILHTFSRQGTDINALAVSPDGSLIAAALQDGSVPLWNTRTDSLEFTLFDHPGIALDVSFSPDGRYLAVGAQRALWVWERSGDDFLLSRTFEHGQVTSAEFSADSNWLAYATENEVWVRRVSNGEVIARLGGHDERVLSVAFSPFSAGETLLATAGQDGNILLWRLTGDREDARFEYQFTFQNNNWVSSLAFSPDGKTLAAGTFGSRIVLWDVPEGHYQQVLQRTRQDQILSLAFNPSGNTIYVGTVLGVRAWSQQEGFTAPQPEADYFAFYSSEDYIELWPYTGNWFKSIEVETEVVHKVEDALDARMYPPSPERASLPENATLSAIAIYKNANGRTIGSAWVYQVTTNFQPARLTIFQTTTPIKEVDWPVSAEAEVSLLNILGYEGEMVLGGWGEAEGQMVSSTGELEQIRPWDAESASIWLRWHDGQSYFSIYYDHPFNAAIVPVSDLLLPSDIINIAQSLYR